MKKLMIICFLVTAMLLSLPVYAEEMTINCLQEDTKVTLSGAITPSVRSENITLVITRKDVDVKAEIGEEVTELKSKLELVAETSTNAAGEWSVVWYPSTVANYDIKATVNSTKESASANFYFIEEERIDNIRTTLLSGTVTQMETLFADKVNLYAMEYTDADIAGITNTSKIGTALFHIREDLETKTEDTIKGKIALAIQMVKFNETASGFAEMTTAMSQFGTVEKLSFYNEISVPAVKEQVGVYAAKGILECGLNGYSDLFTESIVLAGIEKSANYSFLGQYLELLGNSTYDNADKEVKENIQLALVGKSYNAQTLATAITAAASGNPDPEGDEGSDGDNGRYTGGGGGGGGYSTGMSNVNNAVQNTVVSFSDIGTSHWAFAAISNLKDRKIIDGYEDKSFRPENFLTRAETVTLLCRAFNFETVSGTSSFSDVDDSDWFAPYIHTAHSLGYVNGDGTQFNPNSNITRQDLCVMIYRFAQGKLTAGQGEFEDMAEASDYAIEAIKALSSSGIINGFEDNTFRPAASATRAQMAQMLHKCLLTIGM